MTLNVAHEDISIKFGKRRIMSSIAIQSYEVIGHVTFERMNNGREGKRTVAQKCVAASGVSGALFGGKSFDRRYMNGSF